MQPGRQFPETPRSDRDAPERGVRATLIQKVPVDYSAEAVGSTNTGRKTGTARHPFPE
jgi:hypothetical protein